GLTLVSLCGYLSLRSGAAPARRAAVLGLALGALLLTKPHFWIAMLIPCLARLVMTHAWRKLRIATIFLAPSAIAGVVNYEVMGGSGYQPLPAAGQLWPPTIILER